MVNSGTLSRCVPTRKNLATSQAHPEEEAAAKREMQALEQSASIDLCDSNAMECKNWNREQGTSH